MRFLILKWKHLSQYLQRLLDQSTVHERAEPRFDPVRQPILFGGGIKVARTSQKDARPCFVGDDDILVALIIALVHIVMRLVSLY